MSTDNETWRDTSSTEGNSSASRDGDQFNKEGGYNRPSYNRENGGERRYRPRFNNGNSDDRTRSYSNNGEDRPYRNRFNTNAENGERTQRSYSNNRPSYGSSERPFRTRYNNENGERPQRSYGSSERPFRTRYNSENGERPQRTYNNGERPQRPRFNSNDENGGERQQRSYGSERSYGYNNGERSYRPRFNNGGGQQGNGRPQRTYNNAGTGRPHFNNGGGRSFGNNRMQQRSNNYDPNAKYTKKKQIEYKEQFIDPNEPIRLNKFLANAGICSRREADEFITAGVVSVNGEVITELGTKIKRGDEVKFHDQTVSIERKIYVLLNKPKDTVTTSDDPQARRTVMDLVKDACTERIYPVGRLDRNTTGVLLLTNDGDLASKLTHPKYLKKKIYHVHLDKNLTKADMEQIAAGIQLDDGEIHADAISYTDEAKKDDIGIEIHSGKNRIVRRIFESLGYKVVKLDRVFFAGLTKKGLRRGEWRYLTEQEVNFLRMGSFE